MVGETDGVVVRLADYRSSLVLSNFVHMDLEMAQRKHSSTVYLSSSPKTRFFVFPACFGPGGINWYSNWCLRKLMVNRRFDHILLGRVNHSICIWGQFIYDSKCSFDYILMRLQPI